MFLIRFPTEKIPYGFFVTDLKMRHLEAWKWNFILPCINTILTRKTFFQHFFNPSAFAEQKEYNSLRHNF